MNEREERNVYYIPSNYTDSGKWLWGMVEPRNCVEAIVVAVLLGAGILSFNFSFYVRLVLLIVIVFPIFALACFGYKGDSLTQFLGHLFKHFKTRKKLTFRRTGQYEEDLPDKKMGFVQEYIPVEEIRDGIVETTDGRYIKILEVEPINFSLRSDNEREDIIEGFQEYMKIAPVFVHLKSLSRKANSDAHISQVRNEVDDTKQCREYTENYVGLVKDVGQIEAISRRFFLIIQYTPLRKSDNTDYRQVYSELYQAEHEARKYFENCGLEIIKPKDTNVATAEIVYTFFNKKSSVDEPFEKRMQKIVFDNMIFNNQTIGEDDIEELDIKDLLSPRGIDLTHSSYFTMDGLYYSVMYIKADGYPIKVSGGWTSLLVNAGDGVDIDIFARREERSKSVDKVGRRIRLNKSKVKGMQDTNSDYEEISSAINSGYYIKQSLATTNQDLFYMSMFVTITANSYSELLWKKKEFISLMKSKDIDLEECTFQQQDAFKTIMPLGYVEPSLFEKSKRNVLTSGFASTFPFTSYEMASDTGVMLGVNQYNNSLCILDLFDTKVNKNANVNILGTTGAGKTFTMQLLALRMRMRNIQSFIIAPTKGHEFTRACKYIGGEHIRIAAGSSQNINIMEIRHTISPEMELLDGVEYNEMDSMLATKIQQITIFFSLLVDNFTNEDEQMLDEALIKTYAKFGITHDNNSIYEDAECSPPKLKKMPVLGDLYEVLNENKYSRHLARCLTRFVTGSAQSFNQQTNVDLSNKYIVFDLSALSGKLLPVGMMIVLDYLWDVIKSDRTKKKAIFIDEIWQLIGANANRNAADFCLKIFKLIRGYGGAAIAATQDLDDFFALDDGKFGKAIINNSKNKIILNLEPDEAEYVKDILKLTRNEIKSITKFDRGEALIISNNNKVPVNIKASKIETENITTDRAELEAILREKQRKKGA